MMKFKAFKILPIKIGNSYFLLLPAQIIAGGIDPKKQVDYEVRQ